MNGQLPVDQQYAPKCNEYVSSTGIAETCANLLPWETGHNIVNVADNQWWTEQWSQGADIRSKDNSSNFVINNYQNDNKNDGRMNDATAREILKQSWKKPGCGAAGDLSCFETFFKDDDDFDLFMNAFPSVDVTNLNKVFDFWVKDGEICYKGNYPTLGENTYITGLLENESNIAAVNQTFIDKFTGCLFLVLNDAMHFAHDAAGTSGRPEVDADSFHTGIREVLISSSTFDIFLKNNFYSMLYRQGLLINGNLDWAKLFPADWKLSAHTYTPLDFAREILGNVYQISAKFSLEFGESMMQPDRNQA